MNKTIIGNYDIVKQSKMNKIISIFVVIFMLSSILVPVSAQEILIPNWIKNNAKWWSEDKIEDSEFTKGIQYLLQNEIMKIPNNTISGHSAQIPKWVKNNAGWWANGTISDNDFVLGIQYLVSSGIIDVSLQKDTSNDIAKCDLMQTPADKETCIENTEYKNKLSNDLSSAISYTTGPVTFYYLKSDIQYTEDGKSILTVHFIVNDTGNTEITMSCPNQNSCNYALSDGQKEIPYSTNTLVYGSFTLSPGIPKYLDWTFYNGLDYQPTKNYSFLIKEPWGTGSIPLKIQLQ